MSEDPDEIKEVSSPGVHVGDVSSSAIGHQAAATPSTPHSRELEQANLYLQEQVSALREQVELLLRQGSSPHSSPAVPAALHTPALRTSPPLPDIPASSRPTPSVARTLFVQPQRPPTFPSAAIASSVEPQSSPPSNPRPRQRKVPEPHQVQGHHAGKAARAHVAAVGPQLAVADGRRRDGRHPRQDLRHRAGRQRADVVHEPADARRA